MQIVPDCHDYTSSIEYLEPNNPGIPNIPCPAAKRLNPDPRWHAIGQDPPPVFWVHARIVERNATTGAYVRPDVLLSDQASGYGRKSLDGV